MSTMKEIRIALRKDPFYKKYVRTVDVLLQKLTLEDDRKEAWSMHVSRTSRSLYGKDQFSLQKFEQAVLKDLSIRARLVELRVQASHKTSMLERAVDSLRDHLQTSYDDQLKTFKTVDRRRQAINHLLGEVKTTLADGESLIETLDLYIKDIDQANFSLRHIMDTMKLMDSSKGKII